MNMNNPSDYAYFYNSDNGDRVYDSDSMCDWLTPFFTTGVFNGSLQVVAHNQADFGITVNTGFVNIEGKVKHYYQAEDLTLSIPDSEYDRIDTIVVERNDTERDFLLKVITGEPASSPVPTPPVREGVIYQLVLAEVYVRAGETEITQAEITDKRSDESVCGWVISTIEEVPIEQIVAQMDAQFYEWFNNLVYVLDGDVAGHLQNEINDINDRLDDISGGSIITVTIDDLTYAGNTVVATDEDGNTWERVFDENGVAVFNGIPSIGLITASTIVGENRVIRRSIVVDCFSAYEIMIQANGHIFGVEWDGTASSAWSRTDDSVDFVDPVPAVNNGNGSSPFDDYLPWSGMEKVEDSAAGTLVKIPKFWYRLSKNGNTMKIQISDVNPGYGFRVSPAHQDRGDGVGERDYVYFARYHCAPQTHKSTTGVIPEHDTLSNTISSITNLGAVYWLADFPMLVTLWFLYLVEYANWNSQEMIGYGCSTSGSKEYSGATDSMIYHTGTDAESRTTYGHTQYRYIEDLWGNGTEWCDGIKINGNFIQLRNNPAGSYGPNVAPLPINGGGVAKEWNISDEPGYEYALLPKENTVDTSFSSYSCDYNQATNTSGQTAFYRGGDAAKSKNYGLFYLHNTAIGTGYQFGGRIMKLP